MASRRYPPPQSAFDLTLLSKQQLHTPILSLPPLTYLHLGRPARLLCQTLGIGARSADRVPV